MDTRALLSLLVLGASLSAAELIRSASPTVGAMLLVLLGTVVASVASAPSPMSIGLGALAALSYGALRPYAPVAAWASFALLVLLGRGLRARGAWAWAIHTALSVLGGASAMWITLSYAEVDTAVRVAAIVVASIFVAMPLFVPVDDAQTAALLALAHHTRGPRRTRLLRAAALSRRAHASDDLARGDRRMLSGIFSGITRAAERAKRRSAEDLDVALTEQLAAIARFLRAVGQRGDASLGLETRSDVRLELAREALEVEARTLSELAPPP
ncbi:MAG: hypothetical protein K1X94_20730 [Sandaracinaceae bacterium]|nr:hypothetical protein [Sandaracinaceae bacterium]